MKLGKPQPGYRDIRRLTRKEQEITGLPNRVHIMHEHGTGLISFWTQTDNGFSRYVMKRTQAQDARHALESFWAE